MTLRDNNKTVEIYMYDSNGSEWSDEFFDAGRLDCNDGVYSVKSVDYCIEQVEDWYNGVGDFRDCGAGPDDWYDIEYVA